MSKSYKIQHLEIFGPVSREDMLSPKSEKESEKDTARCLLESGPLRAQKLHRFRVKREKNVGG